MMLLISRKFNWQPVGKVNQEIYHKALEASGIKEISDSQFIQISDAPE